jgi:MFS family permease
MLKITKGIPALAQRNLRLYFTGQLVSFCGTWLQFVAQGWLVFEMTHSAYQLGVVAFLGLFPGAALAPFGGVIVDKFDRRKVLYFTQIIAMIQAFILGALVLTHTISLWHVYALSVFLGVINAIDVPARSAFAQEISTTQEERQSAATLNGGMIQLAQGIGSALAGLLVYWIGTGGTFIINGLTFPAVIITLAMMRLEEKPLQHTEHPIKMIWSGTCYTFTNQRIRLCVILGGLIGMLGFSYRSILPVIAEKVFKSGPQTLGYLSAAAGLGAFGGFIVVCFLTARYKIPPPRLTVIGGSFLTGMSLVLFSLTSSVFVGLALLFCAGAGFLISFASVRAAILRIGESKMMGRVTGFVTMFFFAGMALGNYSIGLIAQKWNSALAISLSGVTLILVGAIMYRKIQQLVEPKPAVVVEESHNS